MSTAPLVVELGCGERAALRREAKERPVTAPGLAEGASAPDLATLERPGFRGVYRRDDSEAVYSTEHHVDLVARGWLLHSLVGWSVGAAEAK